MMAAYNNNSPSVISTLIKSGADVNAKDEVGLTAFDCSLKKGTQHRYRVMRSRWKSERFLLNQEINFDVVAELIKLGEIGRASCRERV
jgi:ankyrin repeat protein